MTIPEIFNLLLDMKAPVISCSKAEAESLRVQLVKRWSKYKRELDSVGMLDDARKALACSCQWDEEAGTAKYLLREPTRKPVEFKVISMESLIDTDGEQQGIGESCE